MDAAPMSRLKCRACRPGKHPPAERRKRAVPLRFTFRSEPCDTIDPLQVFAAAESAPRFYWEQPAAGRFRVGIGAAARLTAAGPSRFKDIDAAARELFAAIGWEGAGPRIAQLFGGFAFSPTPRANDLWRGFPSGELRLPELFYSSDGNGCAQALLSGSRWATLRPRPLALGHPVRGVVEIGNGGPDPYVGRVRRILEGI